MLSPIQFFFQRADVNEKPQPDDVLTITKQKNGFKIVYHYYNSGRGSMLEDLTSEQVITYIRCMLTLVQLDTRPFAFIQVSIPCMPDVLLSGKPSNTDAVIDAVRTIINDCPVNCVFDKCN